MGKSIASKFTESALRTLPKGNIKTTTTHCLFGILTEAGELTDIFKRKQFYGKEIEISHVKEEVGDILWYLSNLSITYGFTLEEAMVKNERKLRVRYPDKFTKKLALNRRLNEEMKVIKNEM